MICDLFETLFKRLNIEHKKLDRTLIVCRTSSDCGKLYTKFVSSISSAAMPHVQMYYSKTWTHIKEIIQGDMSAKNGPVRILICTSAAGMGVNFVSVQNVIHYGSSYCIDDLLQQMRRAGRNSKRSFTCFCTRLDKYRVFKMKCFNI